MLTAGRSVSLVPELLYSSSQSLLVIAAAGNRACKEAEEAQPWPALLLAASAPSPAL